MEVRIRLPKISPGFVSNLLGVLGLIAIVAAVAGLTSPWWALLTAGGFCVALAYIAGLNDAPAKATPDRKPVRPTAVEAAARAS